MSKRAALPVKMTPSRIRLAHDAVEHTDRAALDASAERNDD